ncbi:MAG: hypothetical protein RIS47_1104 [Bacteroidota bacterium]|jgi:sigma-E factor negative regulatory protein RseC
MERIVHEGIVNAVSGKSLSVSILQSSGCVSCSVKGACNVAEVDEKLIEITHFTGDYKPGERVTVFYKPSLGFKALAWGYVLPFVLMLTVLILVSVITGDDALAGLWALGVLIPYYGGLYLFRNFIGKGFDFQVEHLEN